MALQRVKLGDIAYIGSSAGTIYDNPASTKTFVKGLVLHNTNTTAETVQVYVVPDSAGAAGTAANSNRILAVALPANDTLIVEFPCAVVLSDTHDTLQAQTTTASKVTVLVLGDKE